MNTFKNIIIFIFGASTIGALLIFSSLSPDKEPENENIENKNKAVQELNIPKFPDSLSFAGEAAPTADTDVRERIDREILAICFWHSSIIQNLKYSRRYFPIIEAAARKHGIPDDFKYLAVTESNLRNATSPAGAKGIWQFMSTTAKAYDLIVNKDIDERLNFFKTTDAACKLLKNLKEKFGSWTLAAAAYNCGEGRLKDRMEEQGEKNYYNLILPEETMRYIPRIIAMKEIMQNPEKYGYQLYDSDFYEPFPSYKKVIVTGKINHWPDFCIEHNISYKTLLIHNPWIKGYDLNNEEGLEFEILIPENTIK